MRKKIKIGNKTAFEINTSNRWAYIYNEYFGHDIMPELIPMADAAIGFLTNLINGEDADESDITDALYGLEYTTELNVIWALAKNADESIPEAEEWYNGFEKFPQDEIAPQVFGTLIKTMVSEKKLQLLQTQGKAAMSRFTRSSSQPPTED